MAEWITMKSGLKWVVAKCVSDWGLGAGYKFWRNENGNVARFWRESTAQKLADRLNEGRTNV